LSEIFSDSALKAQVERLEDLPKEQGGIGVVASNGDVGVEASVNKQLGKGWFVRGDGSWMSRAGYTVRGWFGWKGQAS
jgi:hypothetical protein